MRRRRLTWLPLIRYGMELGLQNYRPIILDIRLLELGVMREDAAAAASRPLGTNPKLSLPRIDDYALALKAAS
jgi:hypothetical protein